RHFFCDTLVVIETIACTTMNANKETLIKPKKICHFLIFIKMVEVQLGVIVTQGLIHNVNSKKKGSHINTSTEQKRCMSKHVLQHRRLETNLFHLEHLAD